MEVPHHNDKHVSFDPSFLEKEEKRKLEKKVPFYSSRKNLLSLFRAAALSVSSGGFQSRRSVDSYRCLL
jgi:hypothetical protein